MHARETFLGLALAATIGLATAAHTLGGETPTGSVFTYQGLLTSGGEALDGAVDLRFRLFDADVAGGQVGPELEALGVGVSDGLLTIDLDFGSVFMGDDRWLEIDVRDAGVGEYNTLAPRQPVRPAPVALFALDGLNSPWMNSGSDIFFDGGHVGIGTGSPATVLNTLSDQDFGGITIQRADNALHNGLLFRNSGVNYTWSLMSSDSSTPDLILFGGANDADPALLPERVRFTTGGAIGIGTSSPKTPISFLVNGAASQVGITQNSVQGANSFEFTTEDENGDATTRMSLGGGGEAAFLRVFNGNAGAETPLIVTNGTGVGIGTNHTASTEKLYVRTEEDIRAIRANNFLEGGTGVFGTANASTGSGIGGEFRSDASNGSGVFGLANSATGINYGVRGETDSPAGYGVWGQANANGGTGVYGDANSGSDFGVFSNGRLGATGTKSFMIDHPLDPENWVLYHYSSESPEPLNVYTGTVVLGASGSAWVALPDYFAEINADPRYQLTAIGAPAPNLHIGQRVEGNTFLIAGGSAGLEVSWEVTARRNDLFVKTNGAPMEREKVGRDRGRFLRPDLYGLGDEFAIHSAPDTTSTGH